MQYWDDYYRIKLVSALALNPVVDKLAVYAYDADPLSVWKGTATDAYFFTVDTRTGLQLSKVIKMGHGTHQFIQSNAMKFDSFGKVYLAFRPSPAVESESEREAVLGGTTPYESRMRIARIDASVQYQETLD